MPSKKKYNMKGEGFFGDVWKGIKTGAKYGYKGLSEADKFLKKTKLASAGLSVASIFQPELAPLAATAGA